MRFGLNFLNYYPILTNRAGMEKQIKPTKNWVEMTVEGGEGGRVGVSIGAGGDGCFW